MSLTQGLKLEKSTQKEKGSLSVLHEATTGPGDARLNTESNLVLIKVSRYYTPASPFPVSKIRDVYTALLSPLYLFWPSILPAIK